MAIFFLIFLLFVDLKSFIKYRKVLSHFNHSPVFALIKPEFGLQAGNPPPHFTFPIRFCRIHGGFRNVTVNVVYKSVKWVGVSSGFCPVHHRPPENASHSCFIMKDTWSSFYTQQKSCWTWPTSWSVPIMQNSTSRIIKLSCIPPFQGSMNGKGHASILSFPMLQGDIQRRTELISSLRTATLQSTERRPSVYDFPLYGKMGTEYWESG